MKKLKGLITNHPRAAVILLFALIVFVGFSATSATRVAQRRSQQQVSPDTQAQTKTAETEAAQNVTLTDDQRETIKNYDDKTRTLIDTLSASIWASNDGRYTLRFYDDYYIETADGKETTHPFAIDTVEYANDGGGAEIDTIVFDTDTGTHIATYTLAKSADPQAAGQSTIASQSAFNLKDSPYTRKDAAQKVEIAGLNSEITALLGGGDGLITALSDWCAVHYPATTKATWTQNAVLDYQGGTITTSFSLSADGSGQVTGRAATVVSVTYTRATGTFALSL